MFTRNSQSKKSQQYQQLEEDSLHSIDPSQTKSKKGSQEKKEGFFSLPPLPFKKLKALKIDDPSHSTKNIKQNEQPIEVELNSQTPKTSLKYQTTNPSKLPQINNNSQETSPNSSNPSPSDIRYRQSRRSSLASTLNNSNNSSSSTTPDKSFTKTQANLFTFYTKPIPIQNKYQSNTNSNSSSPSTTPSSTPDNSTRKVKLKSLPFSPRPIRATPLEDISQRSAISRFSDPCINTNQKRFLRRDSQLPITTSASVPNTPILRGRIGSLTDNFSLSSTPTNNTKTLPDLSLDSPSLAMSPNSNHQEPSPESKNNSNNPRRPSGRLSPLEIFKFSPTNIQNNDRGFD